VDKGLSRLGFKSRLNANRIKYTQDSGNVFPASVRFDLRGQGNNQITSSCLDIVPVQLIESPFARRPTGRLSDSNTAQRVAPRLPDALNPFLPINQTGTQRQPREEVGTAALNAVPGSPLLK